MTGCSAPSCRASAAGPAASAIYWDRGVCLYDENTGIRARIRRRQAEDAWAGTLELALRHPGGADVGALRAELVKWIEDDIHRFGLKFERADRTPSRRQITRNDEAEPGMSPNFTTPPPAPAAKPKWYVSYAWKDDKTAPATPPRHAA